MTYEVVMPYHLHMPSYFLGTFTEYPYSKTSFCSCGLPGCQLRARQPAAGNYSSRNCGTKKNIRHTKVLYRI